MCNKIKFIIYSKIPAESIRHFANILCFHCGRIPNRFLSAGSVLLPNRFLCTVSVLLPWRFLCSDSVLLPLSSGLRCLRTVLLACGLLPWPGELRCILCVLHACGQLQLNSRQCFLDPNNFLWIF